VLGAFFFSQVLNAANLQSSQVTVVPATVDKHQNMMNAANVDAVVTFEPTASTLISQGNVSLFDSSQLPDKIVDVLVTTKPTMESKFVTIEKLVAAHWDALGFLTYNRHQAANIMAPRLHIPAEQLLLSYEGLLLPDQQQNQRLLGGELETTATHLMSLMSDEGLINRNIILDDLISDRLVTP
jgi:NitT/TauT family transport system substrate-binding protein